MIFDKMYTYAFYSCILRQNEWYPVATFCWLSRINFEKLWFYPVQYLNSASLIFKTLRSRIYFTRAMHITENTKYTIGKYIIEICNHFFFFNFKTNIVEYYKEITNVGTVVPFTYTSKIQVTKNCFVIFVFSLCYSGLNISFGCTI